MIPIVSIVGQSGSGKTTLIERLIPELSRRGYKVGTIKHDVHGFEIDKPGKDSYRHKSSGAVCTVLSSPEKVAIVCDVEQDTDLMELREFFFPRKVDIILTEGYREGNPFRKIEVDCGPEKNTLTYDNDPTLLAIVSTREHKAQVACLSPDQVVEIVDLIEEKMLKPHMGRNEVTIRVNNKRLPMKDFVRELVFGVITGLIKSLKGGENASTIEIVIKDQSLKSGQD